MSEALVSHVSAQVNSHRFIVGRTYSRADVKRILGLPPSKGGNWDTGYHQHNGEWFLFPIVGSPARTGHEYPNRWIGKNFYWYGKTASRVGQPAMRALLTPNAVVRLFVRERDRDPFTYKGQVVPERIVDVSPVEVEWRTTADSVGIQRPLPEESNVLRPEFQEGGLVRISVNVHERNPSARRACIVRWGTVCAACGLSLADLYGVIAEGIIHVHHLRPLGDTDLARVVDPEVDLRPVCPNCHTVIHLRTPPLSIEEVRILRRDQEMLRRLQT